MYDHIGLKVGDLDASVRFYTAALAPLGYVLCSRDDVRRGFWAQGRAGALAVSAQGAGRCRRACRVPRARSRRDQAIPQRGIEEPAAATMAAPARAADYSPTYFAAFLIDPDGNNVEAVCT